MKKEEEFNKLIYNAYGVTDQFEKLGNQIKNVRKTMMKYEDFQKLKAEVQFEMCCTICVIATQTARQDLEGFRILGKESTQVFDYSINRPLS